MARSARASEEIGLALIAVPGVAILLGILVFPLAHLLALSAASFDFGPYRVALGESLYVTVLWDTIKIALMTTGITLLLAYPVAYFLATASRLWSTLGFMVLLLPFWTSIIVRTYAWMIILGRDGPINRVLVGLGLTAEPLALLYNLGGVLVGMIHVLLPYPVFPIYAAMVRVDPNLVLAAEGLGARRGAVFRQIYLPLTLKGVFAGAALVFTLSLGAFVTPALLGGGRVIMIANVIEKQVSELLNWPFAGALAMILFVAAVLVYSALGRATGGERRIMF